MEITPITVLRRDSSWRYEFWAYLFSYLLAQRTFRLCVRFFATRFANFGATRRVHKVRQHGVSASELLTAKRTKTFRSLCSDDCTKAKLVPPNWRNIFFFACFFRQLCLNSIFRAFKGFKKRFGIFMLCFYRDVTVIAIKV